jgi:hypothetical protein
MRSSFSPEADNKDWSELNTFDVTAVSSPPPDKKQSIKLPLGTDQREALKLDIALLGTPIWL